jgi:hypothetical protein
MAAVDAHPFRIELLEFRSSLLQVIRNQQIEIIALQLAIQEVPVSMDRMIQLRDIARADIVDGDLERAIPVLRVPEVG